MQRGRGGGVGEAEGAGGKGAEEGVAGGVEVAGVEHELVVEIGVAAVEGEEGGVGVDAGNGVVAGDVAFGGHVVGEGEDGEAGVFVVDAVVGVEDGEEVVGLQPSDEGGELAVVVGDGHAPLVVAADGDEDEVGAEGGEVAVVAGEEVSDDFAGDAGIGDEDVLADVLAEGDGNVVGPAVVAEVVGGELGVGGAEEDDAAGEVGGGAPGVEEGVEHGRWWVGGGLGEFG